jgi:SAM-dependent methyltransferase
LVEKTPELKKGDLPEHKDKPFYGPEVYNAIIAYCKQSPCCNFQQAVDVGCGSGETSVPLAKFFERVIGMDSNRDMISRAPTNIPNLSFRVGPPEDLSPIWPGTTDLVTVAQALHRLDAAKLYKEVHRVLKPGGSFVVYGHGIMALDRPEANEAVQYVSRIIHPSNHSKLSCHVFNLFPEKNLLIDLLLKKKK